mmetsp:Transcript_7652/g.24351  ORF Transcript_7652/g.24351 Transcript_7652/m.24351 type:complete len:161 (+) Transcript_7652:1533-2015(+)
MKVHVSTNKLGRLLDFERVVAFARISEVVLDLVDCTSLLSLERAEALDILVECTEALDILAGERAEALDDRAVEVTGSGPVASLLDAPAVSKGDWPLPKVVPTVSCRGDSKGGGAAAGSQSGLAGPWSPFLAPWSSWASWQSARFTLREPFSEKCPLPDK